MATPEGPDCTGGAARRAVRGIAALGRVTHPGPSLLVTLTTVAAATVLLHRVVGMSTALRITAVVLPAQLAIGAVNDLVDRADDTAAGRRDKPLVTGAASTAAARAVAVLGVAVSLLAAGLTSRSALAVAVGGLGAGLAYDLGLKRTLLSPVPWWVGFACVPLGAAAVAGTGLPAPRVLAPLSLLLALGLHAANAMPDLADDRRAGVRSLPVRIGPGATRGVALLTMVGASVVAVAAAPRLGQSLSTVALGAAVPAFVALWVLHAHRIARPFAVLAPATLPLVVTWLAALPT